MTTHLSERTYMRDEVRDLFHEFFNVLAALRTYAAALQTMRNLTEDDLEIVKELDRLVDMLNARAEQVRARVVNLVG